MRFVTFRKDSDSRPALVLNGGALLDIALAAQISNDARNGGAHMAVPGSMVELIGLGPSFLSDLETIVEAAASEKFEAARLLIDDVTLLAPIPRPAKNVFCVGKNYFAHIAEGSKAQNIETKVPENPMFFTKPPTAVIGPGSDILVDPKVSEKMDYEVELGVVIGKGGRNIKIEDAFDHIFGFTIINDVSARDLQRQHGGQFLKGKGLDTSCPMGPEIVTIDEVPNFENTGIRLSVNGEVRQDGNTQNMIFPIARLIESLSAGLTLEPGDLLATGTPEGVGYAMEPPVFLKDGDTVTCQIDGVGEMTNGVRAI